MFPAGFQLLSQKSRSEQVKKVAVACGTVSGDDTVYLPCTPGASRGAWEVGCGQGVGCSLLPPRLLFVEGAFRGTQVCLPFPEHYSPARPHSLLPTVSCS